ncbi:MULTISPECIES: hypothetical protein [Burkholderia cepacia complex]|uniref:hypothetical protein n=1 Tax=Burkholderia cepacia complex TaxID=87882 RepID=UPI001F28F52E|nr:MULTISPECIES: hypothetical protein [Burkholderia cepacia complex]
MSRLTIVGAGRVGQTLGNLIVANRVVDVGQIYARDIARAAVAFVGAGRAVDDLARVEPADIWLLSVPDTRIRSPKTINRSFARTTSDTSCPCRT